MTNKDPNTIEYKDSYDELVKSLKPGIEKAMKNSKYLPMLDRELRKNYLKKNKDKDLT